MGYVRGIAGGMVQKYGCFDLFPDLCQEGYLALIQTAERFNEMLGLKFWTLAQRRVWGSMIDAFRRWHMDGTYRYERCQHDDVVYTLVSLDDESTCTTNIDPSLLLDIKVALAILSDKERYVITKTYLEGYTLLQLSEVWHLKKTSICVIRAKGLQKMRTYLEREAA